MKKILFFAVAVSSLLFCFPIYAQESTSPLSPTEDLMREHGLLERILLIYSHALNEDRLNRPMPFAELNESAGVIKSFVEDYHEKLEEEYVFPELTSKSIHVHEINILKLQHDRGRSITAEILKLTSSPAADPNKINMLRSDLRDFITMYRPHYAREDTAIFPAFRQTLSKSQIEKFADVFEKRETTLFGEEGFEKILDRVNQIEKRLAINDLAQFTPQKR